MGLFDKIFKRPNPQMTASAWETFTAYRPVFTSFSGNIYESELVRAAIHARATHNSKLMPEISGTAKPHLQTLLRLAPNEFQTWGQFLYRLSTILDVQNTAFIVPVFGKYGETTGIYPILPSQCEIVEHRGEPWLRYSFVTGDKAAVEMRLCGIMTRHQYSDDIFGENNRAMFPTMELINSMNQGIAEGIRNGATYRILAQAGNFAKAADLAAERKRFNRENLASDAEGGGLLLLPNTYTNIQQLKPQDYSVNADQAKLIRENVYLYFGVNEDILTNAAVGDKWAAFYEGAIEPFAIQLSDVLTRMLFTDRERALGAAVTLTANRLQYMTTEEKAHVTEVWLDRGVAKVNEIRQIWNLPPLPDEIGEKIPVRGEYYDMTTKEAEQNAD